MSEKFKRICYDDYKGFRVHHTFGNDASRSTSEYLHYDTDLSFIFFSKGTEKIIIGGNHYNIEEGSVIILNPAELYLCRIDEKIKHERITICVNELFVKNFNSDIDELLYPFYKRKKGEGNFIDSCTVKALGIDTLFKDSITFSDYIKNI